MAYIIKFDEYKSQIFFFLNLKGGRSVVAMSGVRPPLYKHDVRPNFGLGVHSSATFELLKKILVQIGQFWANLHRFLILLYTVGTIKNRATFSIQKFMNI